MLFLFLSMNSSQDAVCYSVVEDQDSSGEGGLTSNWWVIGSQLPHSSEATLQTISHSALSPSSSQNQAEHSDTEYEKRPKFQEKKGKSKFNDEEADSERRKKSQKCDKNKDGEHEETEGSGSESGGLFKAILL